MFISHKHKFIFFHVPKTAGSFIERKLAQMLGESEWRTEWSCEEWGTQIKGGKGEKKQNYIKHMRPFAFRKHHPDRFRDYYKFAIVRDPWGWHLSFFSMITQWRKFSSIHGHHAKNHEGRIHPLNDYATFEEFIKGGGSGLGPKEGVAHMSRENGSPCHRFLQSTKMPMEGDPKAEMLVDDLIMFDDLQKGITTACGKIGIDAIDVSDRDSSTIEGREEPIDCSSKHPRYSEAYDREMATMVAELNWLDIRRFGFTFKGKTKGKT